MVRSEGNVSLKIPVTPPGIDPGTVRLVAQRLKHYATPGPQNPAYASPFPDTRYMPRPSHSRFYHPKIIG